jgi:hypothetical protein
MPEDGQDPLKNQSENPGSHDPDLEFFVFSFPGKH